MADGLSVFRSKYLNATTWAQRKDGVPLYLLDELTPQERTIAEQELIESASLKDSWSIIGLGHICSEKSLRILYTLFDESASFLKIIIAHSIFQINKDPKMAPAVLQELSMSGSWHVSSLIDILYMLPDFQDAAINRQLECFSNSTNYLIAYNATSVLGRPTEPVVKKFSTRK